MPTKVDTEIVWTDQYPHKSGAGDEYYFVRRKDRNDVVIMGFSMGKAWLNGVSYEPSELRSHLFLGPLSPSDFEQLIQLRKQTIEERDVLEGLQTFQMNLGNEETERHWCKPDGGCDVHCERARALWEKL